MTKRKIKIYKDGDMWCVLQGKNLQEGVSAFGKTKEEAIDNFLKEKCNHNAVAKGNGEKNYYCIDCGEKVESLKETKEFEKEKQKCVKEIEKKQFVIFIEKLRLEKTVIEVSELKQIIEKLNHN